MQQRSSVREPLKKNQKQSTPQIGSIYSIPEIIESAVPPLLANNRDPASLASSFVLDNHSIAMDPLKSALNLFRRLPPEEVESTFHSIALLREDLAPELLQHMEFPLRKGMDPTTKREFILSDFNSNGESYRSPWSNKYCPPIPDGEYPSPQTRSLEEKANFLFDKYREMYYGGGVSSVYLWNNDASICGCFLILKEVPDGDDALTFGSWHSLHLVEIIPSRTEKKAEYRLTTTIQLYLTLRNNVVGTVKQNGTLTRQSSSIMEYENDEDHLKNIGQMIEQMENFVRSNLDMLYMSKNQETVDMIRILHPSDLPKRSLLAELSSKMKSVK